MSVLERVYETKWGMSVFVVSKKYGSIRTGD